MKNHYFTNRFENSVSAPLPIFKALLTACRLFFSQRFLSLGSYKKVLFRLSLLLSLVVLENESVVGQTTVTYAQRIAHYNAGTVFTVGTAGAFDQGISQVGMYANSGATKQVVAWRTLKTAGDNTGSNRSLQVGDEFRISVSANTVVGEMGFALLSSPSSRSSWNDRLNNAAVSVRLSNYGNWYATYSDGTTANAATSTGSNDIGGTTSYKNFVFTCLLTAPNRMNITITDGTTTSNLNDVLLNNSNAITEYSIFLSDDWNGVQHRDIYWNTNSSAASDFVRNTLTMPIGGSNGSFTISGVLPNGLAANSTSSASVNALTKSGSGSLTLSNNNTYTGTTTISAGTLLLGAAGSGSNTPLGTTAGATTVSSGAALNLNGFNLATAEGLTINGTGISSGGALINSSGTGSTWTGTVALGTDASVGGSGNITLNGAISGANNLTKVGAGTLTLGTTNTFGGAGKSFTIENGTVAITSFTSNLGNSSNTITLGGSSTSGTLDFTPTTGNVSRTFTVASGGGTFKSNGSGVPTFAHGGGANSITLNGNLTLNCAGSGNMEFNCNISGTGGIIVNSSSTGSILMQPASAGSSTYTGDTKITSGRLNLSGANLISNSSDLVMDGGTFGTSASGAGFSETMDMLHLTASSTIALGSGSHTLTFSASNTATWTPGATLTITGWTGTAGATGSAGKIFVGVGGLDASQLEAITFNGYTAGATLLQTGEIVPTNIVTISSTTTGGNWNATGTWVGGVVPTISDNVRIQQGATVTVTADASCRQLEMVYVASGTSSYTANLAVSSNMTLSVTNSVFVTTGDNQIKTANISGAGTLSCGSISLGTNITPTFDKTNTLNSTISTWTCSGTLSIYGNDNGASEHRATFNLQSGTLTVAGISQTVEGDSDATFTNASAPQSGTLNLTGSTPFTLSGSPTTTLNGTTATVSYQRAGDQTVLATTYRNLTIANSTGVKTSGGAFAVQGTLTVNSDATFAAGHAITTSSAASINGTLRINSGGSISAAPNYGASSTLVYNSGGNYNRGVEWSATSGAGYPANVQISHPGTGTTNLLMLTTAAQCSGNLTLDASTSITTTSHASGLTVLGNVIFNGSYTLGGDLYIGGNYTVGASPAVNNNLKAARFTHATADQTITRTGGGTVFFDYLLIEKATSGNVVVGTSTDIEINTTSGNVLQLNNTGGLDLNGRKLTLNNSGGGIYVNGNRTITSGVAGGDITITNNKFVANNSGTGRLSIGQNVTVNLSANGNIDFGSSGGAITTLEGVLSINSTTSCFVNTNAPIYGSSSTLRYNSGGTYGRGVEWTTATSGAGYPNNVQISNNTTLNLVNGSNAYRRAAGNLTVGSGSTLSIPDLTSGSSGVGVEFLGNIINDGTISLTGTTDERLKAVNLTNGNSNSTATVNLSSVIGGDLELTGNYTDNAAFMANSRAVFFTGTGTQVISGTASAPFNIDYIYVSKASGSVRTDVDLLTGAPAGGTGITLLNATDIFDLNGRTFTLGTNLQSCTFAGSGSFRGSSSSSMIINGTGAFGSLNFESGNRTLNNLTVNRSSTGSVSLGSALTIGGALTLTNGDLIIGSNNLTLGSAATVSSASAGSHIVATSTGEVRKIYGSNGSFTFPVGDGTYHTPATVNFISGSSLSGETNDYLGVRLKTSKVTNMNSNNTNFIKRSWFIEPGTGLSGYTYNVNLSYDNNDVQGTESEIRPVKKSLVNSDSVWQYPGNVSFANGMKLSGTTGGIDIATNVLSWSSLTSFSEFGGGGQGGPLPVELLYFGADCQDKRVSLNWSTASEKNSSHFDIEKSKDGYQWRVINTLPSAGNSNEKIDYYYEDVDATTGAYYRLNQVDIDGKYKIYGPIKADCELEKDLFYSFPNPSGQGGFSVLLNAKELIGHGNLNISDANGTSVYQKSVEIEKGVSLWNINEPNLAPGVYFIKVANENNESKIIKHIHH